MSGGGERSAEVAAVVLDLDDPYFDGQTLPDALSEWAHVHSTTGVCVKNTNGPFCGKAEATEPLPAEVGPLVKAYTYLPDYADVEYVDGKLSVARGILSRTNNPDLRRRWLQTVDILLTQRTALTDLTTSSGEPR